MPSEVTFYASDMGMKAQGVQSGLATATGHARWTSSPMAGLSAARRNADEELARQARAAHCNAVVAYKMAFLSVADMIIVTVYGTLTNVDPNRV